MSIFGDVQLEDAATSRVDLAPYTAVLRQIPEGKQGRIPPVVTGEILTDGPNKGRGSEELQVERNFKRAAREQLGKSAKVNHMHLTDGTTSLVVRLTDIRTGDELANAKRDRGRTLGLYNKRVAKEKELRAQGKTAEADEQAVKAKEAKAEHDKHDAKVKQLEKPGAPVAKK